MHVVLQVADVGAAAEGCAVLGGLLCHDRLLPACRSCHPGSLAGQPSLSNPYLEAPILFVFLFDSLQLAGLQ